VSRYRIKADASLAYLGSTALSNGAGSTAFDARLDVAGNHLFVVEAAARAIAVLQVNGGALSELQASPFELPAGATPFGIVVV
jgi:hypothetical protein